MPGGQSIFLLPHFAALYPIRVLFLQNLHEAVAATQNPDFVCVVTFTLGCLSRVHSLVVRGLID